MLLVLLLLVSCSPVRNISSESKIPSHIELMQMDHLGNYYRIDFDERISKYDASNQLAHFYSNRYFGEISSLDVSDPLKIMVFYKDQQQIVVLDNTMSEIAKLDLSKLDDMYIEVIAKSLDGNIWLFDSNKGILFKTNDNLKVKLEGFPLSQEGINGFSPQQIIVNNQSLLINDQTMGILVFDNYTNYKQMLPIKNGSILYWKKLWFYYLRDNNIFKYDMDLFEEKLVYSFDINKNKNWYFGIKTNYLYLFENGKVLKDKIDLNERN